MHMHTYICIYRDRRINISVCAYIEMYIHIYIYIYISQGFHELAVPLGRVPRIWMVVNLSVYKPNPDP